MNEVKLQESHPIDDVLRPLKVAGETSALEIATVDNGARITGDLEVTKTLNPSSMKSKKAITFQSEIQNYATTGTIAIDWSLSNKQALTITGTGGTVNFTNPDGPCNLLLKVTQGDGNDTTNWDSDVKWAGGSAPTLSTGSGNIDIISFYFDGTNYYGVASLAFS
tara:strand:+ start:480 stop:974 length:495 start_codon:yes stop_codon:yes gene_type:complete